MSFFLGWRARIPDWRDLGSSLPWSSGLPFRPSVAAFVVQQAQCSCTRENAAAGQMFRQAAVRVGGRRDNSFGCTPPPSAPNGDFPPMRVLALEKDLPGSRPDDFEALLKAEAKAVWELVQRGAIREIHFRELKTQAVILMEVESAREAEAVLAQLPLVRAGLTEFEVIGLRPYPGFSRLFEGR
jgi:muconolactone delta-isomerase